ncbi:MAG: RNA 2',3'-cyclic phosphodiesterase [Nanoarchaeota archaeon]
MVTKRLFIGIPLSIEIKENIKFLIEELKQTAADLKLVSVENLHFTLKFLGDVEEGKIAEIKEKVKKAAGSCAKFPVKIKGVGVFPDINRINVLWLGTGNSLMLPLMKRINKQLNYIRKEEHGEQSHLTLARVKSGKNKDKLQDFVRKFAHEEFGEMIVDKVVLCESELTKEGPVYKVVKEFGLG